MSVRSETIAALDAIAALGQRNYSDQAPETVDRPYTVVTDMVSESVALQGDARSIAWRRLVQVDLHELASDSTQATVDAVVHALDGKQVAGSMRLRVQGSVRIPDSERETVMTSITLSTVRLR